MERRLLLCGDITDRAGNTNTAPPFVLGDPGIHLDPDQRVVRAHKPTRIVIRGAGGLELFPDSGNERPILRVNTLDPIFARDHGVWWKASNAGVDRRNFGLVRP